MTELKKIKEKAYSVLLQHRISNPTLDDLICLAEELGYSLLDYSKSSSLSSTELLIEKFGLTSFAKAGNSFVYKNDNVKLIFLNETMAASEKLYCLAHELGHIYCGHLKNGACCKDADMEEEHDANEFAHYLLHPAFIVRLQIFVSNYKLVVCNI